MRKLVVLGLLAVSMGIFTNTVLAGNVEDCETIKNDSNKALYGLCIAYWNTTNAKAQEKILENFNRKAGPGGIGMPGLDDFVPCTCWSEQHVLDTLNDSEIELVGYTCTPDGVGFDVANFNGNSLTFFAEDVGCFFVHPEDGVPPTIYGSADAELTCRAQVHELISELWNVDCTP